MKRATVVHVITKLELGGAQQNTLDTCTRLDRGRFDVALLAGPDGALDAVAARIPDLDFRILRYLVRPVHPAIDARGFRELKGHLAALRAARPGQPLIVHTHSSKAGILGRLAARGLGLRNVVHTVHGFGHPAFHSPVTRALALSAERMLARWTRRFVVVSEANRDEGVRLRLFRREQATLIRSGFDLDEFRRPELDRDAARAALGLPAGAPVVGMIACLKPQKAPLDFLALAKRVLARVPECRFVLAGDGELRDAFEARLRALRLEHAVRLLGWRDDVPELLRALDVCVLTSRYEGLPRVVVQAMAAGVPVVANAVDGVNDVIESGVTGFSQPPGDLPAMERHVVDLLEDPELRAAIVERSQSVLPQFDVAAMVAQQEALYEELLAPGN